MKEVLRVGRCLGRGRQAPSVWGGADGKLRGGSQGGPPCRCPRQEICSASGPRRASCWASLGQVVSERSARVRGLLLPMLVWTSCFRLLVGRGAVPLGVGLGLVEFFG